MSRMPHKEDCTCAACQAIERRAFQWALFFSIHPEILFFIIGFVLIFFWVMGRACGGVLRR